MKEKSLVILNVALTSCGVLFSGYLSAVKFFSSNCVSDDPCPLFLGYPACYFGFSLFLTLFLTSALALAHALNFAVMRTVVRLVSLGGVLFAGYFVIQEVQRYFAAGFRSGPLGLPTCAYGLIFFLIIFGISFKRTQAAAFPSGAAGQPALGS